MQYATLYATSLFLKTYYLVYLVTFCLNIPYTSVTSFFRFKLGVVQLKSQRKRQKNIFCVLIVPIFGAFE